MAELETLALDYAPDLKNQTNWLDFEHIEADLLAGQFVHRWKPGGCAFGSKIVEGKASSAPAKIINASFVDALDPTIPDQRYFLTPNAAVGILRRADGEGRNLFPPMRRALEILVRRTRLPASAVSTMIGEAVVQTGICKVGV